MHALLEERPFGPFLSIKMSQIFLISRFTCQTLSLWAVVLIEAGFPFDVPKLSNNSPVKAPNTSQNSIF